MTELELFKTWLEREMPAGTVIGDPAWWAKKILKAARQSRITADELYKIRRKLNAGTGKLQGAAPTHWAVDETNAKPTATPQPASANSDHAGPPFTFIFTLPAEEAINLKDNIRYMQAALDDLTDEDCLRVIVRLGSAEIDGRMKNLAERIRRAMEKAA